MPGWNRIALLAILPAAALAGPHEQVIHDGPELEAWCHAEAQAHAASMGLPAYQWVASHRRRGNQLSVEGRLRMGGRDVEVQCRVAAGARERHAVVEIHDPAFASPRSS